MNRQTEQFSRPTLGCDDMLKICRMATLQPTTDRREDEDERVSSENAWPAEVELILSALDVGSAQRAGPERRRRVRRSYRSLAELKLFSDQVDARPWVLYTRDAHARGMGFITPHRLPLGYGGKLTVTTPQGNSVKVHCTLTRCREAAPGWYEGALSFNREQVDFET